MLHQSSAEAGDGGAHRPAHPPHTALPLGGILPHQRREHSSAERVFMNLGPLNNGIRDAFVRDIAL